MATKLLGIILVVSVLGFISAANPAGVHAAASLYLSPGVKTVAQGASFSVAVRANSGGEAVNAVQANLVYPADKLELTGVGSGGTAFEIQAEKSAGGGSVRIGRGTVSAKSGDLLVASLTFKARVSSGTAAVSFTDGTAVVRSSDSTGILGSKAGGTYSFSPPLAQQSPALGSSDEGLVNIMDVRVEDIGLSNAAIAWKTNVPSMSLVEYGPSEKLGITVSNESLKTEHKLNLDSKLLFPGTVYYYQVKSRDEAGNESVGELAKFRTRGFGVIIKAQSTAGKPLSGIKVLLFSEKLEADTDNDGIAKFADVAPGMHSVHVVIGRQTLAYEIDVKEVTKEDSAEVIEPQEFTISIPENVILSQRLITLAIATGGVLGLVFFIGLIWWFKFRKKPISKLGS